jgi:hypothetical protein
MKLPQLRIALPFYIVSERFLYIRSKNIYLQYDTYYTPYSEEYEGFYFYEQGYFVLSLPMRNKPDVQVFLCRLRQEEVVRTGQW